MEAKGRGRKEIRMEAKDTVISLEQIVGILAGEIISDKYLYSDVYKLCKKVCQAQAEITAPIFFEEGRKAGYKQALKSICL